MIPLVIHKENKQHVLFTKDGKRVLGRHKTRAAAERQERAIQVSKAKKGKEILMKGDLLHFVMAQRKCI